MISSTNDATAKLTRILMEFPSNEECDAVLRAGGVPIDQWSRKVFEALFLKIRYEYRSRVALRGQSQLAKPLERIDRALNSVLQEFQHHACSLGVEMIGSSGSIVYGLTIQDVADALHYKAKATYQVYHMSYKDLENWLFAEFYDLYAILKGKRPGNSNRGPLYRFTMQAAELVGMKVSITPEAFRMRIKRFGDRRRNELEIPAGVPTDDSPVVRPRFLREVLPAPDPTRIFAFMKK
jgi:hypothetical protein